MKLYLLVLLIFVPQFAYSHPEILLPEESVCVHLEPLRSDVPNLDSRESKTSFEREKRLRQEIDPDFDRIRNVCDNCPAIHNPSQVDYDNDGVGDLCDNCPEVPNSAQIDTDKNGVGDVCELLYSYLEYFNAESFEDGILLMWKTHMEVNVSFFNIWKSENKDSDFSIVKSDIESMGEQLVGAEYEFLDENVVFRKTYYYFLEEIEDNGNSIIHPTIEILHK